LGVDLNPGPIPPQWGNLANLKDLSLQGTNRNGKLPPDIGGLKELVLLDLAGDVLSGEIPSEVGHLPKLTSLLLNDNRLKGSISQTIAQLSALDKLILHDNDNIEGKNNICEAKPPSVLEEFVADCLNNSEYPCCTCCFSSEAQCGQETWFSQQDPVRNYQYTRTTYKFNHDDIAYRVPDTDDLTENYNELGIPDGVPGGGIRARR